ncbi:hypothetical protein ACWD3I_45940 [Streptomyces sp. NPDC002817]
MLLIGGVDWCRDGEWSLVAIGAVMVVASLYQLLRNVAARRRQREERS